MSLEYKEGIEKQLSVNEIGIRWFNDACYEIRLPNGKVILIDPYIDHSPYKLLGSEAVTGADYLLISHTHFDHVMNVGELSKRFHSKVFVGRESAIELARYYHIPGYQLYPCSAEDRFELEDFTLEVIYGKHTNMGDGDCPNNMRNNLKQFGLDMDFEPLMTCGSYEYCNYFITLPDNTSILIWGGQASFEAVEKAKQYHPDISIVQIPRESAKQVAELYAAVGGKVIFPHHHETILGLEGGLERIQEFLGMVKQRCPYLKVICPKKGTWYQISTSIVEAN